MRPWRTWQQQRQRDTLIWRSFLPGVAAATVTMPLLPLKFFQIIESWKLTTLYWMIDLYHIKKLCYFNWSAIFWLVELVLENWNFHLADLSNLIRVISGIMSGYFISEQIWLFNTAAKVSKYKCGFLLTDMINYRFLTTETNLKAFYIFHCFFYNLISKAVCSKCTDFCLRLSFWKKE